MQRCGEGRRVRRLGYVGGLCWLLCALAVSGALAQSETPPPAADSAAGWVATLGDGTVLSETLAVGAAAESLSPQTGERLDVPLPSWSDGVLSQQIETLLQGVQREKYKFHRAPRGVPGDKGEAHFAYNARQHFYLVLNADGTVQANPSERLVTGENGLPEALPLPAWRWDWEVTGFGRGEDLSVLSRQQVRRTSSDAQIRYDYGALSVWYANDEEKGIEQGFTLSAAPAGSGPVVIAARTNLRVTGPDTAVLDDAQGQPAVQYTGLSARDAHGAAVEVRLEGSAEGLRLVLDDTGHPYPLTIDPWLAAYAGYFETPLAGAPRWGNAVAVGDYNGDGSQDIAIGAPDFNSFQGCVYVAMGNGVGFPNGFNSVFTRCGDYPNALYGMSLKTARINSDTIDDLVVGSPGFGWGESLTMCSGIPDNQPCPHGWTGQAKVFYGTTDKVNGWKGNPAWSVIGPHTGSRYGETLAPGDFNGDGRTDLAVGVDAETPNGWQNNSYGYPRPVAPVNAGRVRVYYNSSGSLPATQSWMATSYFQYAQLGYGLAAGELPSRD